MARLYDEATRRTSVQFPEEVLIVVPYKLHTVLTEPSLVRHWFGPNGALRLAGHPNARLYVDFADFAFVRFQPLSTLLNAGFGRAYRLTPADRAP